MKQAAILLPLTRGKCTQMCLQRGSAKEAKLLDPLTAPFTTTDLGNAQRPRVSKTKFLLFNIKVRNLRYAVC